MTAALSASAQAPATPAAPSLSLQQAVVLAFAKSPVLAGARADVPGAQARLEQARSGGRLIASTSTFLSTGTMFNNLTGTAPVMPNDILTVPNASQADQNLMLMYPLYTGGRVGSEVAGAGAELQAARSDLDAAHLTVAYLVRADYWQVLLNTEMVKIARQNLQEQQERLRVDQESFDAGKIPQYYVLRDKAEVADAQQGLTNADRDVSTALLRLRQDLGVPMDYALTLTDALAYESTTPGEAAALSAEALKLRPEARAAAARVEAARRQVAARESNYRPQVAATLMGDVFGVSGGESGGGYTFGVVASLPILDGGARGGQVAEARATVQKAEADQAALDLDISRQVGEALLNFDAANRNVRTAETAVASAEEDYRVATARYQAGKAINLEPISALTVLVRARVNYAQALWGQRTTLDAVNRAVGKLPG
jgi:outer membrane protein TolC